MNQIILAIMRGAAVDPPLAKAVAKILMSRFEGFS